MKTRMTRRTMKTRRMMVMGKMKVKMKVKDEHEKVKVFFNPRFGVTMKQSKMHPTFIN